MDIFSEKRKHPVCPRFRGKVKNPTRKTDVWGTQNRLSIYCLGQPPEQLAGLFPGHGNLLIACVKITSYNQHCSAPFPEPWSSNSCQVYSVEGADAVIQSACIRAAPLTGDFWEPCVTCPVSAVVS